jgi:hypothetical protein
MENISFIPNTQKGSEGYISRKEEHPYGGYIIGFLSILIMYLGALGFVYWYFVIQPTNKYTQILADLNAKNSIYYPKDDLEQTVYNINTVISQAYDITEIIKEIEATYDIDFKTNSWVYNKQKKSIVFSAEASSFEAVNVQVDKIKKVKGVVDVSYPDLTKNSEKGSVNLNISIKLK